MEDIEQAAKRVRESEHLPTEHAGKAAQNDAVETTPPPPPASIIDASSTDKTATEMTSNSSTVSTEEQEHQQKQVEMDHSASSTSTSSSLPPDAAVAVAAPPPVEEGGGSDGAAAAAAAAAAPHPVEEGGASAGPPPSSHKGSALSFKVVFNKESYDVTQFGTENTVGDLKDHLATLSGVPKEMQKLMFKGMMKTEATLNQAGVKDGAKIMLVGSKPLDVVSVAEGSLAKSSAPFLIESLAGAMPTLMCTQEQHKKIIDKGVPPNAHPGLPGVQEPLPASPIQGVLNRRGEPIQVSYKWDRDELWLGSKTSTDKLPAMTIAQVLSEPIIGHEGYHIVALQIGKLESNRVYLYYFPAQFVVALRRAILH